MNILSDRFPTAIRIDDKVYSVNADFRNCIKIILAFEDRELTIEEKYQVMLIRLYGEDMPKNVEQAIEKAIRFLDCGVERIQDQREPRRVYSFKRDAKYIYSGIHQTHGIDLETVEFLHWWKFVFLFTDLTDGCAFNNILSLRQRKADGKLTKEERAVFMKAPEIFDLDWEPYEEEEESEFMRLLRVGEKQNGK